MPPCTGFGQDTPVGVGSLRAGRAARQVLPGPLCSGPWGRLEKRLAGFCFSRVFWDPLQRNIDTLVRRPSLTILLSSHPYEARASLDRM